MFQNLQFSLPLECQNILKMGNTNNPPNEGENSVELKKKKTVERSASYPHVPFSKSFEFILEVHKHFPVPNHIITREDIAAVLKTSAPSIQRDVATAAQYKLLTKTKGGYEISILFKNLKNAFEKEKRKLWLEAFQAPKLYIDLIEKFDNHAIPSELTTHLIRFHDIAEKAAESAANVFIENAKYVGVLNDSGILNFKQTLQKVDDPNIQFAEVITEMDQNHDQGKDGIGDDNVRSIDKNDIVNISPKLIDSGISNEEKIRIPLSDKKEAFLIYPANLNQKDIDVLKKQIEVLELLIK